MSIRQENAYQPIGDPPRANEEDLPRIVRDALGQIREKMERDLASLREKHMVELMVLHDQITHRDNNTTKGNQQHSEYTAESWRVPPENQQQSMSRNPTKKSSWRGTPLSSTQGRMV